MSITPIPDELRTAVIELHGSECLRCGVQCTWSGPTKLHIDHVIPEIDGGPTTLANLQVLCRDCNLNKGADTADYRTAKARAKLARQKKRQKKEWAQWAARDAQWNAQWEAGRGEREAREREEEAQEREEGVREREQEAQEARRQERRARRDRRGVLRRTLTYPLALLPIGALLGLITYGLPGAIVAPLTMYLAVYLVCVVLTLAFRLPSAVAKRITG